MGLNSNQSVRRRLGKPAGWWFIGGFVAAGMAADPIMADSAGQMPPVVEPSELMPVNGGDGARGFVVNGTQPLDYLGLSVSVAGDVTGNGRDDLIVGSPLFGDSEGAMILVEGNSQVPMGPEGLEVQDLVDGILEPAPGWVAYNPGVSARFGLRVRYLGDLDGDGIGDFGVGAVDSILGDLFVGEVFVIYGGDGVVDVIEDLAQLLPQNGGDGSLGFVVNGYPDGEVVGRDFFGSHDINGDGITDLIFLTRTEFEPGRGRGTAFIVYGREGRVFPPLITNEDLLAMQPDEGFHIVPPDPEVGPFPPELGFANGRFVNDLNGDGLDEVILCRRSSQFEGTFLNGECYLVFGRSGAEPFPDTLDLGQLLATNGGDGSQGTVFLGGDSECLGGDVFIGNTGDSDQVTGIGDFNGNGFNDLLIGAPGCNHPGKAYLIYGQSEWPAEVHLGDPNSGGELHPEIMEILPAQEINNQMFAQAVAGIGDFNANGYPDIALHHTLFEQSGHTGAFVIYGGPEMPDVFETADLLPVNGGDGSRGFLIRNFPDEELLGTALSAGDFNGDGAPDLALGGFASDPNGLSNAGRAVVLYGTPPPTPLQVPTVSVRGLVILAAAMLLILLLAGRRRLY